MTESHRSIKEVDRGEETLSTSRAVGCCQDCTPSCPSSSSPLFSSCSDTPDDKSCNPNSNRAANEQKTELFAVSTTPDVRLCNPDSNRPNSSRTQQRLSYVRAMRTTLADAADERRAEPFAISTTADEKASWNRNSYMLLKGRLRLAGAQLQLGI